MPCILLVSLHMHARVCECVRACGVRACVRACVWWWHACILHVCVRVCVHAFCVRLYCACVRAYMWRGVILAVLTSTYTGIIRYVLVDRRLHYGSKCFQNCMPEHVVTIIALSVTGALYLCAT